MKILSIGNSFSQDAHRYLHEIARVNHEELTVVNLYIGGCTLKKHYNNILTDEAAYDYEVNGVLKGAKVSIRTALERDKWDYVTVQQGSHESFLPESYVPYIQNLKEYIKVYSPESRIYIHQTWAYPEERTRLKEVGYTSTEDMFEDVKAAYEIAYELIKADGMIRSGEAMMRAYPVKREKLYADAIHAGRGFGRYLLGLVWFFTFFGDKEVFCHIDEFDEAMSEDDKILAYQIAKF